VLVPVIVLALALGLAFLNVAYTPEQNFILKTPDGEPIRKHGVRSCFLHATPAERRVHPWPAPCALSSLAPFTT
jgi:hypothetical protein